MDVPPNARTRILAAAERLFSERGFDATATSRIATLAAVPKGLVFHYFPTKPDLLRTLVREHPGIGPIDISGLIEPGNPVQSLLNLTAELTQVQAASEVLRVILWREQRTHPEVRAALIEHRQQIQRVIERVLQASRAEPAPVDRLRTAAAAWVAILAAHPLRDHARRGTEPGAEPGADPRELDGVQGRGSAAVALEYSGFAELICNGLANSSMNLICRDYT